MVMRDYAGKEEILEIICLLIPVLWVFIIFYSEKQMEWETNTKLEIAKSSKQVPVALMCPLPTFIHWSLHLKTKY